MKKFKTQLGFTMIELLIVITILGILAVAVLSAINPIEQINRGRDTGSQSDAEQLLSAIDRYNAFQGFYPWQVDADDLVTGLMAESYDEDDWLEVEYTNEGFSIHTSGAPVPIYASDDRLVQYPAAEWQESVGGVVTEYSCPIMVRLSNGDEDRHATRCRGAQELKDSFVTRLYNPSTRTLYVYNSGLTGASTYVCFIPQSSAFEVQASDRCDNTIAGDDIVYGEGLPEDVGDYAKGFICGDPDVRTGFGITSEVPMSCLP